jgi:protein-S-isoprenylcysteine O-methyltransferase Ste14
MSFFDWFQITVLVVFYVVFLGRAIQLRLKGTNPFVLGSGKSGLESLLELSFFVGLSVWTMEIISHSLRLKVHIFPSILYEPLFDSVALKIIGSVLIAGGLTVFVLSLISFGSSWRVGIDTQNAGALVTTGIFSLTRNPIFLFIDMYFLGSFLIYPNLFFGMFTILAAAGIHRQILQEENFLEGKYGKTYLDYKESVGRYL